MELGLHQEQYDALVADLTAEGHDVTIVRPIEQRSGGSYGQGFEHLYDLVVNVLDSDGTALINATILIAMIKRRLPGRRRGGRGTGQPQPRTGELYLPTGETHTWEFPDDD
jgi:hypothetical protein